MSTPPVPIGINKKHMTIAEKKARMRSEAELLTGSAIQEWPEVRENKTAHKRFFKTKNLLASIGKDDALLEPIINRYCLMLAECDEMEKMCIGIKADMAELIKPTGDMDFLSLLEQKQTLGGMYIKYDQAIQTKRKMLLDIERENGMTLLSQIRSTIKKPPAERQDDSGAMFG